MIRGGSRAAAGRATAARLPGRGGQRGGSGRAARAGARPADAARRDHGASYAVSADGTSALARAPRSAGTPPSPADREATDLGAWRAAPRRTGHQQPGPGPSRCGAVRGGGPRRKHMKYGGCRRRGGRRAAGGDARCVLTSGSVRRKCWWRARPDSACFQRAPSYLVGNAPDSLSPGDVEKTRAAPCRTPGRAPMPPIAAATNTSLGQSLMSLRGAALALSR